MYRPYKFLFMILFLFLVLSCKNKGEENNKKTSWEVKGDATIDVFKDTPVVFDPGAVPNGYNKPDANGLIRLMNGRLILKRIELPAYERDIKIKLKVRLVSTGDDYDRSGSIFILSDSKKGVSPIDVIKGTSYPEMEGDLNNYKGIIRLENYEPCVEAMRFMTPFGVGYYSDKTPPKEGVDAWEKDVKWECDISHLYSLLECGAYIGAWIDTWGNSQKVPDNGFAIDAKLEITESKENAPMKKYKVLPLMNTVPYTGGAYPDVFHYTRNKGIDVQTDLYPEQINEACLYYTTTGHGGYGGGDEFTPKDNVISVNGTELKKWKPWIKSCKAYRKWSPMSGWIPQLNDSSSNLARSNWCPGSIVEPEKITIDKSTIDFSREDTFIFNFAIPRANKAMKNYLNFWLVSSYLVYR